MYTSLKKICCHFFNFLTKKYNFSWISVHFFDMFTHIISLSSGSFQSAKKVEEAYRTQNVMRIVSFFTAALERKFILTKIHIVFFFVSVAACFVRKNITTKKEKIRSQKRPLAYFRE